MNSGYENLSTAAIPSHLGCVGSAPGHPSAPLNVNVTKSSVALTINDFDTAQLAQDGTVTLSGTAPMGYSVRVNGALVDGQPTSGDSWYASNMSAPQAARLPSSSRLTPPAMTTTRSLPSRGEEPRTPHRASTFRNIRCPPATATSTARTTIMTEATALAL